MSSATLTSVRTAPAGRPVRPAARRSGTTAARPSARPSVRTAPAARTARVRAAHPPASRAGIVLTARGHRLVRAGVLAVTTAVLALVLVLAWVTVAATVAPGASAGDGAAGVVSGAGVDAGPTDTVEVVVAPGDTLWQLAREHAPGRDPRSVVADIVSLNDLGSTGVQAGAEVLVPVG